MKFEILWIFLLNLSIAVNSIEKRHGDNDLDENSNRMKYLDSLLKSLKRYETATPRQFENYQLTVEKQDLLTLLRNEPGIHFNTTHFTVDFGGETYILDVSLNHLLLSDLYSISSYDKDGNMQIYKPKNNEMNHCYYQGHVRGIDDSQVVLSTCNGLRGSVHASGYTFFIEPLNSGNEHIIYRAADIVHHDVNHTCGCNSSNLHSENIFKDFHMQSDSNQHRRFKRMTNEKKYVELVIVADYEEAKLHSDRITLEARIKEIVNQVDKFYQTLNIRIVLTHVEVWNHSNPISDSTNAGEVLNEFLAYCQKHKAAGSIPGWTRADNYHLLYGKDFDGSTVGMASVKAMCGPRSGGVNQDGNRGTFNTAAIVAHEMGHNFGMGHDTDDCTCESGYQCLMAASLGYSEKRTWSDCSVRYLAQNFGFGLGSCLLNVPKPNTIYGGPKCGNDIVETGEECDCGIPELCKSQCCNPKTCKLMSYAQCDVGLCCSNCQLLKAGSTCRGVVSECDLPEYCTGIDPHCPANVYRLSGSPCASSTATCFDGVCLTLDKQCRAVWGESAVAGIDSCFAMVNAFGDANGNCGRAPEGGFRNCSAENAKCGKLVCMHGESRPLIGRDRTKYFTTITHNQQRYTCKTLSSTSSDNDVTDVGLVRSGTMCGPGKACNDGECKFLPAMNCDDKCNHKGICNNLNNCHCNRGWAPPFCDIKGNGGSLDSGPIDLYDTDFGKILLIVLAGVVLPILLILGTVVWYRYLRGRETIQKWKKNRETRLAAVALSKGKTPKPSSKGTSSSVENLVDSSTAKYTKNNSARPSPNVTNSRQDNNYSVTAPNWSPDLRPKRPPLPKISAVPSSSTPPARPKPPPARKAPPPPVAGNGRSWGSANSSNAGRRPPPRPAAPPDVQLTWDDHDQANGVKVVSARELIKEFNNV